MPPLDNPELAIVLGTRPSPLTDVDVLMTVVAGYTARPDARAVAAQRMVRVVLRPLGQQGRELVPKRFGQP